MMKVLWFSRHEMTPEQFAALEEKIGPIDLHQVSRSINHAKELAAEIAAADVVAIVAPVGLQQQFLQLAGPSKPVIMAKAERILEDDPEGGEKKVIFKFVKWERLVKIDIIMEDF